MFVDRLNEKVRVMRRLHRGDAAIVSSSTAQARGVASNLVFGHEVLLPVWHYAARDNGTAVA